MNFTYFNTSFLHFFPWESSCRGYVDCHSRDTLVSVPYVRDYARVRNGKDDSNNHRVCSPIQVLTRPKGKKTQPTLTRQSAKPVDLCPYP